MAAKRDRIFELVDGWRKEHPGEPFTPERLEASSNVTAELRSTPLRDIRSLLAECESKETALLNEFPHLKTVYSPLSERQVDWEYNLCNVLIPYLRLEIRRRGTRTGTQPKVNIASKDSASPAQREFTHSPDYRSVTLRGEMHKLTSQQAQMIEILHRAHKDGNSDVSIAHILERLERASSRWHDTFKSNPNAKKALVKSGARRGTLRLNL